MIDIVETWDFLTTANSIFRRLQQ